MDKETLFMNIKILKNKKLQLWTKDDIDNLLIIYKYKDCYEYYDIVLKLLKKYIDWRKINNISYCYSLINLINVYLLITESLIINNYVNYYEIYDILHTKSLYEIFFGLSSDTLLMFIVILFMIFRIFYYIKIFIKNNDDLIYDNNFLKFPNNPNLDIFKLNLNINEDLEENQEINNNNNNKFDIKNIFKDFNLEKFNLEKFNLEKFNFKDFDINDFNLEKFDLSSLMKKFEDKLKSNNDNDNKNNNSKCTCHLCNNCMNKKII